MVTVDLLMEGFPGWTNNYGRLGWLTVPLIRTGGKNILFDAGGPNVHRTMLQRLKERGVDPLDVHMVVLSHCHWDHSLGVPLFPNAEIVIRDTELEWSLEQIPHLTPWVPSYFMRQIAESPRLRTLKGEGELLPGIMMIDTPGHSPGHMSMVVDTDQGRMCLAQDALKNRAEFMARKILMTLDDAASTASIEKIIAAAPLIVPGHDRPFRVVEGKAVFTGELKAEIVAKLSPYIEEETVFTITVR